MPAERAKPPAHRDISRSRRSWLAGRSRLIVLAAEVAAEQKNLVTAAQLGRLGLSSSAVGRWLECGLIHRKHKGVYAWGRPDLASRGNWLAATLACGTDSALSFVSAGALHEVRRSAARLVHVTVPAADPVPRHPGIRGHRADLAPQDVTEIDGIPVTSLPRTLLDLATVLGDAALERAAKQAVINRSFDLRAIEDLLRRSRGRRGIRRLRRVLERGDLSADDIPRSGLEIRYAELCARAGLPKPSINPYLLLGDEYHQVDFLWRRERVVIETDSNRYHSDGWQLERDRRRDELLTAHSFRHARVHEDTIAHTPADATRVAAELLSRASH